MLQGTNDLVRCIESLLYRGAFRVSTIILVLILMILSYFNRFSLRFSLARIAIETIHAKIVEDVVMIVLLWVTNAFHRVNLLMLENTAIKRRVCIILLIPYIYRLYSRGQYMKSSVNVYCFGCLIGQLW